MPYYRLCFAVLLIIGIQSAYADLLDPTRPTDYVTSTTDTDVHNLELSQIIISSDRRIAVISGHVVKMGDEIAGMKVIRIDENSVQIQGPDNIMTLFLWNTSVKHEVK